MYTVGARPEFLVEGVPQKYVQEVGQTMNLLVDRVKSGHPVKHGHKIGVDGRFFFVAVQLQGAALHQALASKCLACDPDAQVVQLQPVLPQCNGCNGSGDAKGYEAFAGEGHRLGTS